MNTTDTMLREFNARLNDITASLAGCSIEHAVEVGYTLAMIVKAADAVQDSIKEVLRQEAVTRLNQQPGSVDLPGTGNSRVTVTVPQPKLRLSKKADLDLLQKVLGNEFDLYLETKVTYAPRPVTGDLIAAMPDGAAKTILLDAVEQYEGTPRVSFK